MDWFERLVGFPETSYEDTRAKLQSDGTSLVSTANGRRYEIGTFEIPSLASLRAKFAPQAGSSPSIKTIASDVRDLHRSPEYAGALFQVASQANCLEMIGPDVTPTDGVTRYAHDLTQGPACAIAAGAATIFRNYFVPIGSETGQTRHRQLDLFIDLGKALSHAVHQPVEALWTVKNGYLLATQFGLKLINHHLAQISDVKRDQLRSAVRIGLHWDVEVTDTARQPPPFVSQAFCSALPIAYSMHSTALWAPLARLVLEASYEATLLAGAINCERGRSKVVLLTHLGGGSFRNPRQWIEDAIDRAAMIVGHLDLDIRIVSRR